MTDYVITITTLVDDTYTPNTTLAAPVLVNVANSALYYTGTHIGDGSYRFLNVEDAKYKLYESYGGSEISKWGGSNGKYIGDGTFQGYVLEAGNNALSGNNAFTGNNTHTGTETFSSINTDAINEKTGGSGVTFNHPPKYATAPASGSVLANKTYTDAGDTAERAYANGAFVKKSSPTMQILNTPLYLGNTVNNIPPLCDAVPNGSSLNSCLANAGWVNSQISTAVSGIASGNYQESVNIIRLMPSGTALTGQIYLTWATALTYARTIASSSRNITVLISGTGSSYSTMNIDMVSSSYVGDYIHFKGLGSNVKLTLNSGVISSGEFSAGAVGRIVMEDLYFYNDDNDDASTAIFENIIFKNCKFEARSTQKMTFTTCRFEGVNTFASDNNDDFTFTNCTGDPINVTDGHTIIISGSVKINYGNTTEININALKIGYDSSTSRMEINAGLETDGDLNFKNSGSRTPTTSSVTGSVTDFYGTDETKILAEPSDWLEIKKDGTRYVVPIYEV